MQRGDGPVFLGGGHRPVAVSAEDDHELVDMLCSPQGSPRSLGWQIHGTFASGTGAVGEGGAMSKGRKAVTGVVGTALALTATVGLAGTASAVTAQGICGEG